ncbi:hypothetical protein CLV58_109116 [Spirosoma oryzae]|uniref:Uncharacterized protein n=1 Tax=Spirosoma oryzae TaxID=1469603 RepID=A0A2T0SYC6_9BACT|nr:hypothetical protein [Spirosoma oryzae]PRY38389.1 hypothetical protein CLV58_109116 [Spirosoma oryzae]
MRKDEVAKNVIVRLREGFQPSSLLEEYMMKLEFYLFIREKHIYDDGRAYVWVSGASEMQSSPFYLDDLEVVYGHHRDSYLGIFTNDDRAQQLTKPYYIQAEVVNLMEQYLEQHVSDLPFTFREQVESFLLTKSQEENKQKLTGPSAWTSFLSGQ